jgi:hypothetical protein
MTSQNAFILSVFIIFLLGCAHAQGQGLDQRIIQQIEKAGWTINCPPTTTMVTLTEEMTIGTYCKKPDGTRHGPLVQLWKKSGRLARKTHYAHGSMHGHDIVGASPTGIKQVTCYDYGKKLWSTGNEKLAHDYWCSLLPSVELRSVSPKTGSSGAPVGLSLWLSLEGLGWQATRQGEGAEANILIETIHMEEYGKLTNGQFPKEFPFTGLSDFLSSELGPNVDSSTGGRSLYLFADRRVPTQTIDTIVRLARKVGYTRIYAMARRKNSHALVSLPIKSD